MPEKLRRLGNSYLLLGLLLISCNTPTATPSPTEFPTRPVETPTLTSTLVVPTKIATRTVTPLPTATSLPTQEPTTEILRTPTPTTEPITAVVPGDVLIFLENNWIIIKEDGRRQQITPNAALAYQEKGAIIPSWFTKNLINQFLLNSNSRQVIGGPIKSAPSTYIPVCSYDQKAGAFSWPPTVHWDSQYVAVTQENYRLRLCDFPPHHEGVFYSFPPDWEISNIGFGAGKHINDLLVTVRTGQQKYSIFWIKNATVTDFPDSVITANHAATNLASEIKMRYLKGAIPRSSNQQITPELIIESDKPLRAMPIWNSFP